MIASLVFLISAVAEHTISPQQLLRSAAAALAGQHSGLCLLVLAAGRGADRTSAPRTPGHTDGAFLFPQMTMDPAAKIAAGEHEWEPNFVDYLFLAFNTSTAFSPTDVPVLSRWAKILMMIQSLISLLVIACWPGVP